MPVIALEHAFEIWLRDELPLPEEVGDVSFESPEGTWGSSITRPTINLFLFDVSRAAQPAVAPSPRRDATGVVVQDRAAPAMSFWYLVSAWGGGVREEHQLLGDAVKAALRSSSISVPAKYPGLIGPAQVALADASQVRGRDLWGNLGGKLRPSVVFVATAAVALDKQTRVAPPVERVRIDVAPVRPSSDEPSRWSVWFGQNRSRVREPR
ncbi:Pvc16 family protein [Kineosporia babensis]|uniref:DUF4255 domain-containing protein n=1 Tax=Kineosporia babensis TaxID=499548 RepID=A0A9X1NCC5_9ACTN|nr:Pvc16 family protein [Kineosporia babensis]MCD5310443.1 DUF4255 domain-containing protein [Kineosporia babensis]